MSAMSRRCGSAGRTRAVGLTSPTYPTLGPVILATLVGLCLFPIRKGAFVARHTHFLSFFLSFFFPLRTHSVFRWTSYPIIEIFVSYIPGHWLRYIERRQHPALRSKKASFHIRDRIG
ncbi:hypothetical protein M432DRAFT_599884 [Thermoascus aurantiacus ATCC 26904]